MAMLEYRCVECGSVSEFLTSVSSELSKQAVACESCGSSNMKRVLSMISMRVGSISDSAGGCACAPSMASAGGGHVHGAGCGCGHAH